ncbi:hypothetical protein [Candidatus Thiosymbion oneisti]|uniref:hypothetical protein n=1 Tax=Candidatus Thiosymbion oneisti TaxID=589554 RepID=UPI000AA98446|nr:hypothetical protein [Candidatus Thiosymbion oneisti]
MNSLDIAVTGLGLVTARAASPKQLFRHIVAGKSCIAKSCLLEAYGLVNPVGAFLSRDEWRYVRQRVALGNGDANGLEPHSMLALYAACQALDSSGLSLADKERICEMLRKQDALHLVHPITHTRRPPPRNDIRDFRDAFAGWRGIPARGAGATRKVAFINHLITPQWLTQVDPSLAGLDAAELRRFVLRMVPNKGAAPYDPIRIRSSLGGAVDFSLYPLAVCSEQMVGYLRGGDLNGIRAEVEERVLAAAADGCEVVGLGMYTSIVTNNCTSLRTPQVALTSGNALTVGMGLEALERAMAERGIDPANSTLVVVGGAGNIATAYASLLAARVPRLTLLGSGRKDSLARLRRTAERIYGDAFDAVTKGRDKPAGIEAALAESGLLRGLDPESEPGKIDAVVAERVQEHYGEVAPIRITSDRGCLREADLVVCTANADTPFLTAGDFKDWFFSAQAMDHLIDSWSPAFGVAERQPLLTFSAEGSHFDAKLRSEAKWSLMPMHGDGSMLQFRLTYRPDDHWSYGVSVDLFDGASDGLFGQFDHNDRILWEIKYQL